MAKKLSIPKRPRKNRGAAAEAAIRRAPASERPSKVSQRPSKVSKRSAKSKRPARAKKKTPAPIPELAEEKLILTSVRLTKEQHKALRIAAIERANGKRADASQIVRDVLRDWRGGRYVLPDELSREAGEGDFVVTTIRITQEDHKALHLEAIERPRGRRADASAVLRELLDVWMESADEIAQEG